MADTINREEFVAQMLAPTSNVVDVSNDEGNQLLEKLHEGVELIGAGIDKLDDGNDELFEQLRTDVQEVGSTLGENFEEMARSSEEYAEAAIEAATSRSKTTEDSGHHAFKTNDLLNSLLHVQQAMFAEFKSQNTMWVGVSKFGQQAENQLGNIIANAIQGNVAPTITNANLGGNPAATLPAVLPNTQAANTIALVNANTAGPTTASVNTAASAVVTPPPGGGGGGVTGAPTGGGGSGGGSSGGGGGPAGLGAVAGRFQTLAFAVEMATSKIMGAVGALGVRFSTMWEGVIANQAIFQRNMRNMLFTTQGFVKANREIEKSYFDITNAVSATGQRRVDFQKEWMRMVQRGFKISTRDAKLEKNRFKLRAEAVESTKAVVTSAMATAKQLDLADGSMSNMVDMMGDWAFHLGMSEFQIANMGREMQRIARNTGVTGDRLMNALKASNKFMEMMRSSANLTEKASTNIMALTTSLEKRGVLDKFSADLQGLTSRAGFFEVDDKTRNFLTQMAAGAGGNAMGNLLFGKTLDSEENIVQLQQGLGPVLERYLGGAARDVGFAGVDSSNLTEVIEKLRNAGVDLSIIDQQMRAAFGKGLGDIERFNEGLNEARESMQPVGIQMDKLAAQIRAEEAAGRGMLDATNEMRKRFDELQTDSIIRGFSALTAQTKEGFGVEELRKRLSDTFGRTPQGQAKVDAFVTDPASFAEPLIKSLETRAKGVDRTLGDLLGKRGFDTDSLMSGLAAGGEKQVAALRALQEAQNELGTLEKDSQDPINSIQRDLSEINNKLGGWFGGLLGSLSKGNLVGIIVAALVAATGANILMGGRIYQLLSSVIGGPAFRAFSRFFGGAGRVAATGGATVGRATGTLAGATTASATSAAQAGNALNAASRSAGMATNPFATMSGSMGNAARANQAARLSAAGVRVPAGVTGAATGARGFFATLGKFMGPLTLAIGGLTGAMEANEAGMKKSTGALMGVLTGGAKTGSMFSSMLGVEKGSAGDKALGALGGAAWGAAAGAALAPFTAGLSIPIAAAIGAAVGLVTEVLKVITEGTNLLDDLVGGLKYLLGPVVVMLETAWYMLKGAWRVLKGLFSLDFSEVGKGLFDIVWALPKAIMNMVGSIFKAALAVPQIIWRGLKMAGKAILDTVKNLPSVMSDIWDYISEAFMEGVTAAFGELWNLVSSIWNQLPTLLMGALKAVFIDLPNILSGLFITALKAVFLDLPIWLGNNLLAALEGVFITFPKFLANKLNEGFKNLLANETLAPIIQPFFELWKEIEGIFNDIKKPFIDAFKVIKQSWEEVVTALQPLLDVLSEIKTMLFGPSAKDATAFGETLKVIAQVIGFVLKVALTPLIYGLKALGVVIKGIMYVVTPVIEVLSGIVAMVANGVKKVIGWFGWLFDVLVGHSIIPDLCVEIVKFFATLPLQVPRLLFAMGSKIFTAIGSWADNIGGPIGMVLQGMLYPFKLAGEAMGVIADAIGGVISGIRTGIDGIVQTVEGIFTLDFNMIKEGICKVFSGVGEALKAVFWEIPSWLSEKFLEGISALPGLFMDGIKAVFVDFPTMVLEGFKTALGDVWEWIKSWVPGAGAVADAAKGFSETNEDAAKRIEKEGSGIVTGLGRTAGGVKDIFTGGETGGLSGRWEGVKKVAGGAWETTKGVGKKAWEGTKAVGRALNPLNWFAEGSREITQPGVAVLHEGEMIVPKDVWDSIKGAGKPFGGMGGMLESAMGFITNPFGSLKNMFGLGGQPESVVKSIETPIEKLDEQSDKEKESQTEILRAIARNTETTSANLKSSLDAKTQEAKKTAAEPQSLGAFASGESTAALMSATDLETKKMDLGEKLEEAASVKKDKKPKTSEQIKVSGAQAVVANVTATGGRGGRGGDARAMSRQLGAGIAQVIDSSGTVITPIVETVTTMLSPVIASVTETLSPVVTATGMALSPVVHTAGRYLGPVVGKVGSVLGPVVSTTANALSPMVETAREALSPFVGAAMNVLSPVAESLHQMAAPLIEAAQPAIEFATSALSSIDKTVSGAFGYESETGMFFTDMWNKAKTFFLGGEKSIKDTSSATTDVVVPKVETTTSVEVVSAPIIEQTTQLEPQIQKEALSELNKSLNQVVSSEKAESMAREAKVQNLGAFSSDQSRIAIKDGVDSMILEKGLAEQEALKSQDKQSEKPKLGVPAGIASEFLKAARADKENSALYDRQSMAAFGMSLKELEKYSNEINNTNSSLVSKAESALVSSETGKSFVSDSDSSTTMEGGFRSVALREFERENKFTSIAQPDQLGAFSPNQVGFAMDGGVDQAVTEFKSHDELRRAISEMSTGTKVVTTETGSSSDRDRRMTAAERESRSDLRFSSSAESRLNSIVCQNLVAENFRMSQVRSEQLGAFAPTQATSATQSAMESTQFTDPFNFSSLSETLKTMTGFNLSKYITEKLGSAFGVKQTESTTTSASMQNLGAFSDKQSSSAIESAISERTTTSTSGFREMVEAIIQSWVANKVKESETGSEKLQKVVEDKVQGYQKRLESISMQSLGAFSSDQSRSAQMAAESEKLSEMASKELNSIADSALEKRMSRLASKDIDVGLSRALYTDKEDIPVQTDLDTKLMDAFVSTNPVGNIEEASAIVNPLLTTRAGVEEMLERQKAGEESASGMATLPDMSAISAYLIGSQSEKLDRMIMLLENIDRNTQSGAGLAQTIGAIGGGSPAIRRPGVRRMGREFIKGQLDLQPLEVQSSSVNTDGRGGF